jgi:putative peptide modification system cyclase
MSAVELPVVDPDQGAPAGPLLRTLALCDLVDSTGLVERLGDQRTAALMRRHDRLARDLLHRYNGQEIDKTDGFLVLFERPIQAIAFALAYQRELARLGEAEQVPLQARVGVHVGDVMIWQNSPGDVVQGAKPVEVEGLVKPVTARLASLALPGQILVSGVATSLAQRAHEELGAVAARARWLHHGRYLFKGVPEPLVVYEIGEPGVAPLRLPPYTGKAHREVPWWRRPATVAIEAVLILSALAVAGWFVFRPQPAIAFAQRDWIVLGDFQNLTGQTSLDDSLRTALRIGLEQSRYVNVVSDLQVRDTVRRMQRDPAQTRIDRTVGAEIAMREGARALVLPIVAEVGGKLRVTTEVVDPNTQATVYSESAEGDGVASVLPSVDRINKALRGRLGETLAAIGSDSPPLAKVTTSNIDALRAYSLGLRAHIEGRWADSLLLFDQATKVDGDFALAYLGKARVKLSSDDRAGALADVRAAQALREHLPPRETLMLDALAATYGKPSDALDKWKVLGSLYPDAYFAHANYALYSWQYTNRYDAAIEAVRKAINDKNPYLGQAHYLYGTLLLATDRVDAALKELDTAQSMRGHGLGLVLAEAYAAQRKFDLADKALADSKPSGVASNDIFVRRTAIALDADRGRLARVRTLTADAAREGGAVGALYERVFRSIAISLEPFGEGDGDGDAYAAPLKSFVDAELAAAGRREESDNQFAVFNVLLGGYVAARRGDAALARRAVDAVAEADVAGFVVQQHLRAIVRAEIARAGGKPDEAVALLRERIDGTELYLTHVALRDALTGAGQRDEARAQDDWLAAHRGRAYGEFNHLQALKPLNVIESNVALLHGAELALAANDRDGARTALAQFAQAWPDPSGLPAIARRAQVVRDALAQPEKP